MSTSVWLDVAVIIGTVLMAISGWRVGVVATSAGFVGFVGGALSAAWAMSNLLGDSDLGPWLRAALTVAAMTILGVAAQVACSAAARRLRDSVSNRPVRVLDSASGMAVSAGAWLFAVWMMMSVLAYAPTSTVGAAVHGTRTYSLLQGTLSEPGSQLLGDVRALLTTLDVPNLAFNPATVPTVPDPNGDEISAAAAEMARRAVMSITASSATCGSTVVGSAFVVGPERVATNAHVVAGADDIRIRLADSAQSLRGHVVHFDAATDLAVLLVPGLSAPVPQWLVEAPRNTRAVVAGFPGGGPLRLAPARVRGEVDVADAVGSGTRTVHVIRGVVEGGNSGGALLDMDGRVIGVIFANLEGDDSTGFALSAEEVLDEISGASTLTGGVSHPGCPGSPVA